MISDTEETERIADTRRERGEFASTEPHALGQQYQDYLLTHLDHSRGKKLESKQMIDKGTEELKYKDNQIQFKLNADLDNVLDHKNGPKSLRKPTAAA